MQSNSTMQTTKKSASLYTGIVHAPCSNPDVYDVPPKSMTMTNLLEEGGMFGEKETEDENVTLQ